MKTTIRTKQNRTPRQIASLRVLDTGMFRPIWLGNGTFKERKYRNAASHIVPHLFETEKMAAMGLVSMYKVTFAQNTASKCPE